MTIRYAHLMSLIFSLFTQVSDSGPHDPLVFFDYDHPTSAPPTDSFWEI